MNRLPMEQREPTGPAMQSSDGGLQESDLKGDYTCHWKSLVLEESSVPREEMCDLALTEQSRYLLIAVSAPSIDSTSAV